MKKYVFISLLIGALKFALTTQNAFAWSDDSTHPLITEAAIEKSILGTSKYLNDNLGFNGGLEQIVISEKSIKKYSPMAHGRKTREFCQLRGSSAVVV